MLWFSCWFCSLKHLWLPFCSHLVATMVAIPFLQRTHVLWHIFMFSFRMDVMYKASTQHTLCHKKLFAIEIHDQVVHQHKVGAT